MTELVAVKPQNQLTAPVASNQQLIQYHGQVAKFIVDNLKYNLDYGLIPGTKVETLLKPGAEKIVLSFGCHAEYFLVSQESDHDRENKFIDKWKKPQVSQGLYRFVYKCRIVRNADNVVIGECDGVCSTMEAKYISRPRDCENTAAKMAQKRALVGAVLHAFALSNRFTQDMDDAQENDDGGAGSTGAGQNQRQAPPTAAPQKPLEIFSGTVEQLQKLSLYLNEHAPEVELSKVAYHMDGLTITTANLKTAIVQANENAAAAAQEEQTA